MPVTDDALLADLNLPHRFDEPLAEKTWYGVGGAARIFAEPRNAQQLGELVKRCRAANVPVYVLGSGANLLVADEGVDGVVVQLNAPAFCELNVDDNIARVGAGFDLMKLVMETARRGLGGIEQTAGIPASVGGAIRMNAGGAYGDIGSAVRSVTLMDADGNTFTRDRADLVFGYRQTNIAARFILQAEFELEEQDADALAREVKRIYTYKKSTQPLAASSAGCTFKNHTAPDGHVEPAGKLIDLADLKGHTIGGASVSRQHANFIVCHDGCTATDVLSLIAHIQRVVADRFAVELEREVVVWP